MRITGWLKMGVAPRSGDPVIGRRTSSTKRRKMATSLAALFPTKRRIFSASGVDADVLVKQAQRDLNKKTKEAEKAVFRFGFSLEDVEAPAKKKNKKKNKKKKKKPSQGTAVADDVAGEVEEAKETEEPAVTVPELPSESKETKKKKKTKKKKQTAAEPVQVSEQTAASMTESSSKPVASSAVAPPPGFLKLRKPTNSDSEVMKMQLRYGRGRRNLAAIAQREKQKKEAEKEASSEEAGAFQFKFF